MCFQCTQSLHRCVCVMDTLDLGGFLAFSVLLRLAPEIPLYKMHISPFVLYQAVSLTLQIIWNYLLSAQNLLFFSVGWVLCR